MKSFTSSSIHKIQGQFAPPGDKSISHRAVMLASVASGRSVLTNFLEADDCIRTIEAFREMGVPIDQKDKGWLVQGVGLRGLKPPGRELYLGNSGTTMRLLLGILAHQLFQVTLTGDDSLSRRPMRRVTVPLRKMGAQIFGRDDANHAPLKIQGGALKGIHHINEPPSAQVKSAILLAGLAAEGETVVQEPTVSRDHTERMLEMVGAPIERKPRETRIRKAEILKAIEYKIPGDLSAASFMIVAAAVLPGSDLLVQNVGLNPTRIGILEALRAMGADIDWKICSSKTQTEPAGEIHVRGSSRLQAITIEKDMIPKLIDELPILMIACALAKGDSVIRDAYELRIKETDRIASMVNGLKIIGGKAEEREDGCLIQGVEHFQGGKVLSFGDHRTAMSFAVAGLKSTDPIIVEDIDCVATSYPDFFRDLEILSKKNE